MHDLTPGARVSGTVHYHGEDLYGPKVDAAEVRRRIGMVFQKPNPFPKSVYDNVAYGPRINGVKRSELDDVVESGAHVRRALGRGEGQGQEEPRLRSPAVSSNGSASRARSRCSPT